MENDGVRRDVTIARHLSRALNEKGELANEELNVRRQEALCSWSIESGGGGRDEVTEARAAWWRIRCDVCEKEWKWRSLLGFGLSWVNIGDIYWNRERRQVSLGQVQFDMLIRYLRGVWLFKIQFRKSSEL